MKFVTGLFWALLVGRGSQGVLSQLGDWEYSPVVSLVLAFAAVTWLWFTWDPASLFVQLLTTFVWAALVAYTSLFIMLMMGGVGSGELMLALGLGLVVGVLTWLGRDRSPRSEPSVG